MTLRFHWRLLEGGEASRGPSDVLRHDAIKGRPDLSAQAHFCRDAEEVGIDSLLVNINYAHPEPMLLAMALSRLTSSIQFMVAVRPGLMSPTLFVQQVNTFSALAPGRISLNVVAGHTTQELTGYGDTLDHDRRYARMDEFLTVCRLFWQADGPVDFAGAYYTIHGGRLNTPFVSSRASAPEVFVGGNSTPCRNVAARHGTCWVRFPLVPNQLAAEIRPVLDAGKQVGLRLSVITRPTREEAMAAARVLVARGEDARSADERSFVQSSDSQSVRGVYALAEQEWLTPCLWTGVVRRYGAPSVALLGSYDEVAAQLIELGILGLSHFILTGWPKWDEMIRFGREVIPRVRALERRLSGDRVEPGLGSAPPGWKC
jgi:alkanesulfonate monooxygenase